MGIWQVVGVLLLLAAVAVLTSMWKAREASKEAAPTHASQPPRVCVREFSLLALSDAFEPETAPLWEPQIEMLRFIGDAGPAGLDYELLRPRHYQMAARYPELYEGSDLESWLEAMERAELISWHGSSVRLTAAGTAFLRCRLPVTV
jgi:hypothetical protein